MNNLPTRRGFWQAAAALAGLGPLASLQRLFAAAREKARPMHLKITDLKTFVINQTGKNADGVAGRDITVDLTGLNQHRARQERAA